MGLFSLYEDLYFTYLEINPLGMFVYAYWYFLNVNKTFVSTFHVAFLY